MPYIKYISIDSSYRNRNQFPLPAQFTVSMGCPSTLLSPTSGQTPVYPLPVAQGSSALVVEPIAFAQANATNTTDEVRYLPYLYCVNKETNCTQFRVDPLVLQSVTLDDLGDVQVSNDYPLNTIPLERANNAYIGKVLENVTLDETRQIISSSYTDEDIILQTLTADECIVNDLGQTQFKIKVNNAFARPTQIYRHYVGKYLKVNGENFLIINSEISAQSSAPGFDGYREVTLTLNTSIGSKPVFPVEVQVIATESWFVEVDRPFSTDPPAYPSYNIPVTELLYTTGTAPINPYIAHDIITHSDLTIGMVVQTSRGIYYYTSTNSNGTEFNDPVFIVDGTSIPNFTSFVSGETSGISVALVGGFPAIAFTTNTVISSDTTPKIVYVQADDVTGTTWDTPSQIVSPTPTSKIKLIATPADAFGDGTIFAGDPMIIFTDDSGTIFYSANPELDGSGTWVNTDTTITGDLLDAGPTYFEDGGLSYLDGIGLLYNDASSDTIFTAYHPTTTKIFTLSDTASDQGEILIIPTSITPSTFDDNPVPFVLYSQGTDLYGVSFGLLDDTGSKFLVQSVPPQLLYSGLTNFDGSMLSGTGIYYQSSENGEPATFPFNVVMSIGDDIIVFSSRVDTLVQNFVNTPLTVRSTSLGIKSISSTDIGTSVGFLPYVTISDIQLLSTYIPGLNTNTTLTAQYRVREGAPITTGDNSLTATTSTTLSLPSVQSVSVGDYIWVYNTPTDPTPSSANFHMYNDIRRVTDVNRISNTLTIDQPLSADINTFGMNNGGSNDYRWEIWSAITDSYYPLEFVGETPLVMQAVCYYVRLVSLTLPNITLSVGNGKLIADYPYVYVQFESQSISHRSVIISNNPNSRRVLFKVPITNLVSPDRSDYVNLSGGGMEHIIVFTPMDSFIFTVFLPNGEIFQTLRQDPLLPFGVDETLQVSATFQIRLATDYYEEQQ